MIEKANAQAHGNPEESSVVVNIFSQAYSDIFHHGSSNPDREVGGLLMGSFKKIEPNKYVVDIAGIVEADIAAGGPSQMQFTGNTWIQLLNSARNKFPRHKVVGWYHTHPGMGAFFSSDDLQSHSVAFSSPFHVACVCDPIKNEFSLFAWEGAEVKALKGYYVIDNPAEKISAQTNIAESNAQSKPTMKSLRIPLILMAIAVLTIIGIFVYNTIKNLEKNHVLLTSLPAWVCGTIDKPSEKVYIYLISEAGSVKGLVITKGNPNITFINSTIDINTVRLEQPQIINGSGSRSMVFYGANGKDQRLKISVPVWTDGSLGSVTATLLLPPPSLTCEPKKITFDRDNISVQLLISCDNGTVPWTLASDLGFIEFDRTSGDSSNVVRISLNTQATAKILAPINGNLYVLSGGLEKSVLQTIPIVIESMPPQFAQVSNCTIDKLSQWIPIGEGKYTTWLYIINNTDRNLNVTIKAECSQCKFISGTAAGSPILSNPITRNELLPAENQAHIQYTIWAQSHPTGTFNFKVCDEENRCNEKQFP